MSKGQEEAAADPLADFLARIEQAEPEIPPEVSLALLQLHREGRLRRQDILSRLKALREGGHQSGTEEPEDI
jgi:hypothetical protein